MKQFETKFFTKLKCSSILVCLLTAVMLAGCTVSSADPGKEAAIQQESDIKQPGEVTDGLMKVTFLDVGQGDSALIESEGHFMLIDGGERQYGPDVAVYLERNGVEKLEYVVATHPHSDHIGGLTTVLRSVPVGGILLPQKVHTTKTYEDMLDIVEEKEIPVTVPVPGQTFKLGKASVMVVAPNASYGEENDSSSLNNWSIGLKITNGNNRFLFCGDAQKEAEEDILNNGLDIGADVMKISHHGSYTSSSAAFLDRVNPEYAVISCGKNNDYGYPHGETIKKLKKRNIRWFRTDELGTITAVSDGTAVTWQEPGEAVEQDKENGTEKADYVINMNRGKFHRPECSSAQDIKEHNRKDFYGSREELVEMGYEACQSCHP